METTDIVNVPHKSGIAWEHLQKYGYLKKKAGLGVSHIAVVLNDNTLGVCGSNKFNQCDTASWSDLESVVCTGAATIGLKKDGKVIFKGLIPMDNKRPTGGTYIDNWPSNIIDISGCMGPSDHVLGLSSDGYVYAFGGNDDGQCEVNTWDNIEKIYAFYGCSVGIRKDGSVVACGCDKAIIDEVAKWKDIEHIFAGGVNQNLIGLKYDGTVVTTNSELKEVLEWKDIIDICCYKNYAVGLKGNGEVCFAGKLPVEYKQKKKKEIKYIYINYKGSMMFFSNNGQLIFAKIDEDGKIIENKNEEGDSELSCAIKDNFMGNYIQFFSDGYVDVDSWEETTIDTDITEKWRLFLTKESIQESIDKLNGDKKKNILYGVLCLIFFWPASIYFFNKGVKISREIKKLKNE